MELIARRVEIHMNQQIITHISFEIIISALAVNEKRVHKLRIYLGMRMYTALYRPEGHACSSLSGYWTT